jgi:sortase A
MSRRLPDNPFVAAWIGAIAHLRRIVPGAGFIALAGCFLLGAAAARADVPPVVTNPVKVTIPALGVSANVQDVGLADDGSMGVPVGFDDVAFYDLGVDPGQAGYAAFTGHISSTAAPGVFYNIDQLGPGNTIHVFGDDGTELVFIVQEVDRYQADNFPLDRIFGNTDQAGLVLITCTGDWDPAAHLFSDRVVVYATLATS